LRQFADGRTVINLFTEINHTTLDAIAQVKFTNINKLFYF
jgi:hypothetical protein